MVFVVVVVVVIVVGGGVCGWCLWFVVGDGTATEPLPTPPLPPPRAGPPVTVM